MSLIPRGIEHVTSLVRGQTNRFRSRYSSAVEGTFQPNGQRVLLWVSSVRCGTKQEVENVQDRFACYLDCGLKLPGVLGAGVDRSGIAYLMTEWHELETVAVVARQHQNPGFLFWQMATAVSKLHHAGMPFGDISEHSFLIDGADRVYLCGLPLFGFAVPDPGSQAHILNYLSPEPLGSEELPFGSDLFALGAYAHQIFTRRPFPHTVSRGQFEEYRTKQTPNMLALAGCSTEWALSVIQGLMNWNTGERMPIDSVVDVARASAPAADRLRLTVSSLRETRVPRPSLQALQWFANLNQRVVVGVCSILMFVILLWHFGSERLQRLPEDYAKANLADAATKIPGDHQRSPSLLELASSAQDQLNEPVKSNPWGTADGGQGILPGNNLFAELERLKKEETKDAVLVTTFRKASDRDLVTVIQRGKALPVEQTRQATQELFQRKSLKLAPRLGLLVLSTAPKSELTEDRRDALQSIVGNSVQSQHVSVLAQWESDHSAMVLASLAARAKSPEIVGEAFTALTSIDIQSEPLRTIAGYGKAIAGDVTPEMARAIATLMLSQFADARDVSEAELALSPRLSPLMLRYLRFGMLLPGENIPMCPWLQFSSSAQLVTPVS